MMSCMMSKGARDNEDAQSFGYRYDDDLNTRRAVPALGQIGPAYDAYTIPGFTRKWLSDLSRCLVYSINWSISR